MDLLRHLNRLIWQFLLRLKGGSTGKGKSNRETAKTTDYIKKKKIKL